MDAGQRAKERAIFTKQEAEHYNSLTLDELVDKMNAKCGHHDMLGYFAGTVCGECAKEAHRKATGK